MYTYIDSYCLPIDPQRFREIEALLRRHDPLCVFWPDVDCYDVLTFRRQKTHYGAKTFALFDRNILVDVLELIRPAALGLEPKCSDRGRIGAAVMCFLQACNAIIEPSMSLYENPVRAGEDLSLFRRADNVDASVYARIALGQLDAVPCVELPEPPHNLPAVDWHKPITYRRKLRVAVLKIAEIDLSDLTPLEKMQSYLRWTFDEYIFIPAAVLMAATHFSPQRVGAMLRNIRSGDRAKAIKGINNAVWDLHLLLHWTKCANAQTEKNRIWILCSRDGSIKRIARSLYGGESKLDVTAARGKFYGSIWSPKDSARLCDLSGQLEENQNDPSRRLNGPLPSDYLEVLERDLEAEINDWRP